MKRSWLLILLASFAVMAAAEDVPPPPPLPDAAPTAWPQQDMRTLRELQAKTYGSPETASNAPAGEAGMALAKLGASTAPAGSLGAQDYDALFALLERYRDELLKMGMGASDLDARVKALRQRADELKARLDVLNPKDGLKLHGRIYSFFDDMNVLGNAKVSGAVNVPDMPTKAKGSGLRFQFGAAHAEIGMEFTRGPLSANARFDVVEPWGSSTVTVGGRRVDLEIRLPVTLQVGDIFAKLTPLTLWRNDQQMPFEPEPFASRRQRLEDDMDLRPDRWRLLGARASTDLLLFGSQSLELESTSAIVGAASAFASAGGQNNIYTDAAGNVLSTKYSTYLETWRAGLPLFDMLTLSDQGTLFWDVTSTQPEPRNMRGMQELVHSGRADFHAGIFKADFEYAGSAYTAPSLTYVAKVDPLTGTAMTYSLGIEGAQGHLKAFGRTVSSGFHAAGAQGRTQDASYEFLGPFPTENSQVGADGSIGLQPGAVGNSIPISFASRFNDVLIPPGTQIVAPGAPSGLVPVSGSVWQHLLAFNFLENLDPYGAATPNRQGFGVEGEWKGFGGLLVPKGSYEAFKQIDSVPDTSGAKADPFVMTRLRAGMALDLRKGLKWPFRLSGGYTLDDSRNGAKNAAGFNYGLTSTLLEGGLDVFLGEKAGVNFGYRHMDVNGFNERFYFGYAKGFTWDVMGYGAYWLLADDLRLDLVYTQSYEVAPTTAGTELEVDQGLLRVTLVF